MKWFEFKEAVQKLGVKDDTDIWFIDIPDGISASRITIDNQSDNGTAISWDMIEYPEDDALMFKKVDKLVNSINNLTKEINNFKGGK